MRMRRLLFGCLLSALVVVGLVGLFELAFRPQMARIDRFVPILDHAMPAGDGRCFDLAPDQQGIYEGWLWRVAPSHVAVGGAGLREPDGRVAAFGALEGPRLLVVGDSMVFGLGVDVAQSMPRVLGEPVRALGGDVLNAGVPSFDLDDMMGQAIARAQSLRPDAVVVVVDGNDLLEQPCAVGGPGSRSALRESAFLRLLFARLFASSRAVHAASEPDLNALRRQLDRWRAAFPDPAVAPRLILAGLAPLGADGALLPGAVCQRAGVACVSIAPTMAELHRDRERFLITGEGHPNADGYRRMAEALWQQLAPLL